MKSVKRSDEGRVIAFHPGERGVLAQLVAGLIELVSELLPDSDDEFAGIVADAPTSAALTERDPALQRLFPSAYADEAADAEFRRFAEPDAARAKVDAAIVVWNRLRDGDRVVVADAEFGAWLKTLTNLRLALSERDDRDLDEVYEWLGWVLESLLEA